MSVGALLIIKHLSYLILSYLGMCPPPPSGRVFLHHFGLKTGMVFEGIGGACVNVFIMSLPDVRKKEKYANSNGFEEFF